MSSSEEFLHIFRLVLAVLQTVAFLVAACVIFRKTIVPTTVKKLVLIGLVFCAGYLAQLLTYDWWWVYLTSRTVSDAGWGIFYWYFAVEYYASSAQIEAKLLQRPKTDGVAFYVRLERIVTVTFVLLIVGESVSESVQYAFRGNREAIYPVNLLLV